MNELHRLTAWHNACRPDKTKEEIIKLYKSLIREEFNELMDAPSQGNLIKEAADLIVVASGLIEACGHNTNDVLTLVNDSNMSKFLFEEDLTEQLDLNGKYLREVELGVFALHRSSDSKMLKSPKYQPVDESLLED